MKPIHATHSRQPSRPQTIRVNLRNVYCLIAIREAVERATRKADGKRSFEDCYPASVGPDVSNPYRNLAARVIDCTEIIRAREAEKNRLMLMRIAAYDRTDPVEEMDLRCRHVGQRVLEVEHV